MKYGTCMLNEQYLYERVTSIQYDSFIRDSSVRFWVVRSETFHVFTTGLLYFCGSIPIIQTNDSESVLKYERSGLRRRGHCGCKNTQFYSKLTQHDKKSYVFCVEVEC